MASVTFANMPFKAAIYQPLPQESMDVYSPYSSSKEHIPNHDHTHRHCQCQSQSECETQNSSHNACHARRRRCLIHFLLASAGVLLLLAAASFVYSCGWESVLGMMGDGAEMALGKRQSNGSSNNDQQGVFVKNKLYLIVVLVGLFVCLILAIMLAAWCCRGAFNNPLCCPCYLCACCGGLACLECISCGLCAEGVDQIGFN
ncbi:uncharacterized protein FOMMEDRAFT_22957 [Fomitiporia mediterranea MF3/22]|uniref:uncharacterized protein n=1 Tax=Fomitiporia mediterranea (strain MF3/22) TaxID=694068 RepID=UPI0004407471|nr:uncharacterized protein FOMMEDRAFT_22957 [Fomitiporia mediterranea MF3/22]EJC99436.1 hypothetical protein FOMMEDRAFT_22957 [Fomitiporia mediterranea MF3/22]